MDCHKENYLKIFEEVNIYWWVNFHEEMNYTFIL
jgi:hypothetical protein